MQYSAQNRQCMCTIINYFKASLPAVAIILQAAPSLQSLGCLIDIQAQCSQESTAVSAAAELVSAVPAAAAWMLDFAGAVFWPMVDVDTMTPCYPHHRAVCALHCNTLDSHHYPLQTASAGSWLLLAGDLGHICVGFKEKTRQQPHDWAQSCRAQGGQNRDD